jgi:hypothetical protein
MPASSEAGHFARLMREAIPDEFHVPDLDLTIPHPSAAAVALLDQAKGPLDELMLLSGAASKATWAVFRRERPAVLAAFCEEIRAHYHLVDPPSDGWGVLVSSLERYGDAVEYDLWTRQDDLHDYFAGRKPWRKLANILRRLPSHSHFITAQRNDPELAEQLVQSGVEPEKWTPPATEWGLPELLTAALFDRLGNVITAVQAGPQRRPQQMDQFPRPETEIDRARRRLGRQAERELDELIAQAHETYRQEHGTVTPSV